MKEGLKKLDKKFLYIAGGLIIVPILLIMVLAIIQGCANRKTTYSKYEQQMIKAATKYFKSEKKLPKDEGKTEIVELSDLVADEYLKSPEKALKDNTCTGNVTVRMNGSSIEQNNGGKLNYTVDLNCDTYSTEHLVDRIMSDLVTDGNGLYEIDDLYVYKGNKVHNYITFYKKNYRIMSIDKDGIMKLVRDEHETSTRLWDSKYNVDVKSSYGKTIYKDSRILDYLIDDYNNPKRIKTAAKEHIVAYDSCVGKRSINDYTISHAIDCSEVVEKQVISLPSVSDFALASLDKDCTSLKTRACKNYNYLKDILSSTWTMNSINENTYQPYYIHDGIAAVQNANSYNEYNIVIYIDGNELYQSGKGMQSNPYIFE